MQKVTIKVTIYTLNIGTPWLFTMLNNYLTTLLYVWKAAGWVALTV